MTTTNNVTTRHQVTCHNPDDGDADRRMQGIGGSGGGGWYLTVDQVIAGLENRSFSLWTNVGGKTAEVIVAKRAHGRKYIKTTADGVEPNNLLALPTCT